MIGGILVIAIIFLFLRDLKSTLIICTSIPISVIGTFALLYFGGYTLNTLTFGGLALGIGMIVDAAIVVLENTYRHLEMGKDRITAAIDGSRRSVVGDSRLDAHAHRGVRADAVPDRRVEHHVRPARRGGLVLAGDVAAGRGDDRPGAVLAAARRPPHGKHGERRVWRCQPLSRPRRSKASTRSTRARCTWRCPPADRVRDRLRPVCRRAVPAPRIGFEFQPTTDEGEVTVDAELAVGTRIENTENVLIQLEDSGFARRFRKSTMLITQARRRRRLRRRVAPTAATSRCAWCPGPSGRARNEQISMELRRAAVGHPRRHRPGPRRRAASNMMRGMGQPGRRPPGGRDHAATTSTTSKRIAQDVKTLLDSTPGVADSRLQREEGRPELAVRVDRDKAALLGMTVTGVANTIRTNVAGTQAAHVPRGAATSTRSSCGCARRTARRCRRSATCCSARRRPGAAGQERHGHRPRHRPGVDRAQEPGAHPARQRRNRSHAQRGRRRTCRRAWARSTSRRTSRSASAAKSRNRPSRSASCSWC